MFWQVSKFSIMAQKILVQMSWYFSTRHKILKMGGEIRILQNEIIIFSFAFLSGEGIPQGFQKWLQEFFEFVGSLIKQILRAHNEDDNNDGLVSFDVSFSMAMLAEQKCFNLGVGVAVEDQNTSVFYKATQGDLLLGTRVWSYMWWSRVCDRRISVDDSQ